MLSFSSSSSSLFVFYFSLAISEFPFNLHSLLLLSFFFILLLFFIIHMPKEDLPSKLEFPASSSFRPENRISKLKSQLFHNLRSASSMFCHFNLLPIKLISPSPSSSSFVFYFHKQQLFFSFCFIFIILSFFF